MRALAWIVMLVAIAACDRRGPSTDSRSNWLHECSDSSQCGTGLECICGVCTMECGSADACDRGPEDEACIAPASAGLPVVCGLQSDEASQRICLAACSDSGQCGPEQRCMRGSCIAASLVVAAGMDASVPAEGGMAGAESQPPLLDSSTPLPDMDASRPPSDADVLLPDRDPMLPDRDPMLPDHDPMLPDSSIGQCLGIENCCHRRWPCGSGEICHVDQTCIAVGEPDSNGVSTLTEVPDGVQLFAANGDYVYGADAQYEPARLIRWPAAGGPGQEMAGGMTFVFEGSAPLILDASYAYFVARASTAELNPSLWRVPIDDSAPPVAYGGAGEFLLQDAEFLYFTNAGDSRVLRVRKDAPEASGRETFYTSQYDAPDTIGGLAINSTALFVIESGPQGFSPIAARAIDKVSKQVSLIADSNRLGGVGRGHILATDAYFVVIGGSGILRFDLASLELTPLGPGADKLALVGSNIYFAGSFDGSYSVSRVDLIAARRDELLVVYRVLDVVASQAAAFAIVRPKGSNPSLARMDID